MIHCGLRSLISDRIITRLGQVKNIQNQLHSSDWDMVTMAFLLIYLIFCKWNRKIVSSIRKIRWIKYHLFFIGSFIHLIIYKNVFWPSVCCKSTAQCEKVRRFVRNLDQQWVCQSSSLQENALVDKSRWFLMPISDSSLGKRRHFPTIPKYEIR